MGVGEDLEVLRAWGVRLDERPEGDIPCCESCEEKCGAIRQALACWLLRVRDKDGRVVPLKMNAAQREFERRIGRRNIVLKARQLGLTTWVAARFFLNTITRPGTLSVQVAHDRESAEEIFRIVHRFLENLPEAMREGALVTSRANVRQIVFPKLDGEYRVESAADPNAGRGLTIQNLHCSEVARWPGRAAETLGALRAAVPPHGEIVLESTPNGAHGCFYREWQEAERTGYVRHFFPWWTEPRYRALASGVEATEEERALMFANGLDLEQVAFRREMRAMLGTRWKEEFAEDASTCFLSSGESFFDVEAVDQRLKELSRPIEVRDNGRLEIYWPAVKQDSCGRRREYIVAADPAGGGVEGDFATVEVVDRETGWQCAEWYGHCTPRELARKAAEIAREYNDALLVVERNNHGHAVLAQLETVEEYERVYRSASGAGWLTTAANRPQMLENLAQVVASAPELLSSRRLLEECRTFVRHKDGSVSAANGEHDDAVMAMALGMAVRKVTSGARR